MFIYGAWSLPPSGHNVINRWSFLAGTVVHKRWGQFGMSHTSTPIFWVGLGWYYTVLHGIANTIGFTQNLFQNWCSKSSKYQTITQYWLHDVTHYYSHHLVHEYGIGHEILRRALNSRSRLRLGTWFSGSAIEGCHTSLVCILASMSDMVKT